MFKILLIIVSLSGAGNGHINTQVIGSYNDPHVCETIARQMTQMHKFPDTEEYNDVEVIGKCFQDTDKK